MAAWVEGRVAGRRRWSDSLHSLQVDAPEVTFIAGQFARLALPGPPDSKEAMIGRPYSFVNPPATQPHEFYFIILPEGPLSPRLATLDEGDSVWLAPRANGFFSIGETADAESLWCLSTGTGIGPFLSMLRTPDPWTKFGRVVLVHSVRHAHELTYRDEIAGIGTFLRLPFMGDSLAAPVATDLSAWELAQLGWVRFRADSKRSLHCRLGGEPTTIGGDGVDALEGMPLTALTRSPHLKLASSETVGADTLELYERA